jgi:hypothetical protein
MNANVYCTVMTKEFRRNRAETTRTPTVKTDLDDLLSGDWAKRTFGNKQGEDDWYNG